MIEYTNIQKQFNDVIEYSQNFNAVNSKALLEKWATAKEKFYRAFGEQLIYNAGPIILHLPPEQKQTKIHSFVERCQYDFRYSNGAESENVIKLSYWIRDNSSSFFDNVVSVGCVAPDGTNITPGMKLTRAFKYFIKDSTLLDDIQTEASRIIAEDRIEGELCLSIHPLDFLSSSENTYRWRSCHALDGEYRSGNLSYMMDSSTIITYIKGEDNVKLPDFPSSVPWNSKKWRMLLFTSQNNTCLFAGRQYPLDLGYGVLDIILGRYAQIYHMSPSSWSAWHDDQIKEFTYKNDPNYRDSGMLAKNHVIINGYIYKITRLIKDVKGSKHFNDLLFSSCYTPRYCWLKGSKYVPEFNIGGSIPCPVCGNYQVEFNDIMACDDCANQYGLGDHYYSCCNCGDRVHEDDAIWVECEDGYICNRCYNRYYFTCDDCGEVFPNDREHRGTNGCYYCDNCAPYHDLED